MACHTRSTSLPTRSHPFVLKAQEELNNLQASMASPTLSYEIMLDAIKAVGRVYECINDLFCISTFRHYLSHSNQRRFLDEELEESIKLIDICSTSRDSFDSIKGQLRDLESALRRGESEIAKSKVREYIHSVKKANKAVKKVPAVFKSESTASESSDVAALLFNIREFTSFLLQSLFSFLPKQIVGQKTSKWSAVKRLLQKSRVACEESVDDVLDISNIGVNVQGLENELEILFRHLVKCRVSLLNISSF